MKNITICINILYIFIRNSDGFQAKFLFRFSFGSISATIWSLLYRCFTDIIQTYLQTRFRVVKSLFEDCKYSFQAGEYFFMSICGFPLKMSLYFVILLNCSKPNYQNFVSSKNYSVMNVKKLVRKNRVRPARSGSLIGDIGSWRYLAIS